MFIVSLYAAGVRHAADCLPGYYDTREAAAAAGDAEIARVAAIKPLDRLPQIDWAHRFTIRKLRPMAWERMSAPVATK